MIKLSVVSTLYNSAPFLEEFCERITMSAQKITEQFEIILVNDGSPNNCLEVALNFQKTNSKIKIVDLSRNFGHHAAIMSGLSQSSGELIFLIDSDLEEDPELLEEFYDVYCKSLPSVVFGVQKKRINSGVRNFLSTLALKIYKNLSGIDSPQNQATVRLMSRQYVNSLLQFTEKELFLEGLFYLAGFSQIPVYIQKNTREGTNYTFLKRVNLFINAICSFSNKPLYYIFFIGVVITLFSIFFILSIFIKKYYLSHVISGWSSIIASTWLLGGIIIFGNGIIAIYLSKLFNEVKGRPRAIVRHVYSKDELK